MNTGEIRLRSSWHLTLKSVETGDDLEQLIEELLSRLPSEEALWQELSEKYQVDLICGLHLAASNRGVVLGSTLLAALSKQKLSIGFDIYFDNEKP